MISLQGTLKKRRSEDMSKVTMKQIKIYWVLLNQIGVSPAAFEQVLASRGSAFILIGETRSGVLITKARLKIVIFEHS